MRCTLLIIISSILILVSMANANSGKDYFPERNKWQSQSAVALGFNQAVLDKAIKFAENNEYKGSRDLRIAILEGFEREPFHEILGPTKKKGRPNRSHYQKWLYCCSMG